MIPLDDKLDAIETSLLIHEEGRMSDEELKKIAKALDGTSTIEEITDENILD